MSNINIKSLAEELHLSAATISRALRDSYEISNETKQKVWALAKQLNYEPNPFASNLRKQKSKTIAVVVPEIDNHFFSLAINGIEDIARKQGYQVLINQSHDNEEEEIAFTSRLLSGRVDGILISLASKNANNQHFKNIIQKIPTVFFDRTYEDIDAMQVTTNDYKSAYDATKFLIDSGSKRIAFLAALHGIYTGKKRMMGYQDALKDHDIVMDERLVIDCSDGKKTYYGLIRKLLTEQQPDGILSSVEELVLPCYQVCKDLGLAIPDDLKLISFSNMDSAPFLNPPLSTITQPAFEMGQTAADILFKILNKKWFEPNQTIMLESVLIDRQSTALCEQEVETV